jgi:DNA-binding CsgD family transcriptional regulator
MAPPRLVGRTVELDQLSGWVGEVAAGRGRAVLVEGEPGIGKSALLQAAADATRAAGCGVFWGTGEELTQAFPLGPMLQAFGVRATSPDRRRVAVFDALQERDAVAATEALLDLIDQLCAESPTGLVVDDLHWADPATVAVCHRLARSVIQRPLLLICAMRPVPRRDDLRSLRRAVGRDGCVALGPLTAAAAADLVAQLAGGAPGPGLVRLAADASGNPLYLTELVDALDRGGGLAVTDGTAEVHGGAAPATLADAISDRLDFLPVPVREVLQTGALLGGEFTVDDLVVVCGRPPAELAPVLADAQAAGVVSETESGLAFRHPLIRAALYDQLPPPARIAWHQSAAGALRQAGAAPERVAGQLLPAVTESAGHSGKDLMPFDEWVPDWLVDAATVLVANASQVAVALLRPTLELLPTADSRRERLIVHLARALAHVADYAAVETLVAETLPHLTDPHTLVELYETLVSVQVATRAGFEQSLAGLNAVLAEHAGLPQRYRLRLRVLAARVEIECREVDDIEASARHTLADAIASGDRWSIGWMSSNLSRISWMRGNLCEPPGLLRQGLAAIEGEPGLIDLRLLMMYNLGITWCDMGRFDDARATYTEGRRLAERTGNMRRAAMFQRGLCQLYFEAGHWDEALAEADLPEDLDAPLQRFLAHHAAAVIAFHRGDPAARDHLAAADQFAERVTSGGEWWLLTKALEHEVNGDLPAALRVLSDGLASYEVLIDIDLWLADAVRLALLLGQQETAATASAAAVALAGMGDDRLPRRAAISAHCRGLLAAEPALLLQAADDYQLASWPLQQAQALEAAACLLADGGDAAAARAPAVGSLDIYTELGARWDVDRARNRFRSYGLRQPTRRLRRPTTGWDALTAAEARVTELVAQARSNPEIAEQLVVSRRTVESHVARVLAKLELRSRVDLVRAVASRARSAAAT